MELKKKPRQNIEVGPIHIIGEFIDDASQQSPPVFPDPKKNQPLRKPRKKTKRNKK